MQVVKKFTWEVTPVNTPLYKKKCSKCRNSKLYYCSNKFRLNSQKKNIDVWLIYRCVNCDDTTNITILSRTKPGLIDKDLFRKFSDNDEETAWKYVFDADTIRRNRMEFDYSNVEYTIIHDHTTLQDIGNMTEDLIEFEVKSSFNLDLKLSHVIRKGFDISLNQLEKMLGAGVITVMPLCVLKKCKVKNGITVIVHPEKLKVYL
ncbi:DUF1062 domain-containing protein [Pedobacter caeni]|uniref:DUF1062 domain-containing protein n=1 Tax=Pedobacter caeni TaxID=288992 RepID=A0A1M4TAL7_9SPHI|nr:DUF1062 domain-containing protein [Pedobacter caeni]SHE41523.1 hypothetical protein SAMN04488522_101137 [Pedobacter caeni]